MKIMQLRKMIFWSLFVRMECWKMVTCRNCLYWVLCCLRMYFLRVVELHHVCNSLMFWGLKLVTKIIFINSYSPEQLFAVVAAVDFYEDFLPWCQRSEILRHHPDGSFDAELEIAFKFLVESYVSHVVLDKPKLVKV